MPIYQRKGKPNHWLIKFDLGGKTHYASHRGSKRDAKTKEAKLRAEIEANGVRGFAKTSNPLRQKLLLLVAQIKVYLILFFSSRRTFIGNIGLVKPLRRVLGYLGILENTGETGQ